MAEVVESSTSSQKKKVVPEMKHLSLSGMHRTSQHRSPWGVGEEGRMLGRPSQAWVGEVRNETAAGSDKNAQWGERQFLEGPHTVRMSHLTPPGLHFFTHKRGIITYAL